jgi:hypothetical protein
MTIDSDVLAKIASPVLSLVLGALVKHYTEARSRVVSFVGHVSAFTLQGQHPITVHTHSIVVRNIGRKAAKNVRLSHGFLPENFTVYPPIQYNVEQNPKGASEIVIPILVPKEQVTISYIYFPPLIWNQINVNTKSDEGYAKIIKVIPMPHPNKAVLAGVWTLMFIGASFAFYWLVRLVLAIIQT